MRYIPVNHTLYGIFIQESTEINRIFDPSMQTIERIVYGYFEHKPSIRYYMTERDLLEFYKEDKNGDQFI